MTGGVIICMSKCWPCTFGDHYDPPQRHSWMDDDDIEAAWVDGQVADPDKHICGCPCAKAS